MPDKELNSLIWHAFLCHQRQVINL